LKDFVLKHYKGLYTFDTGYPFINSEQDVFIDQFDKLYYQFSVQKSYKRNGGDYKRSNVLSISKNSPLEISVFIEKNWFEILLFLLSTNRETIILNLKQNYQEQRVLTM
jgi:hypothetical protein